MKIKELKQKSPSELPGLLKEKRAELRLARFRKTSGTSKNTKSFRILRKDIARILTLLHFAEHGK